MKKVTLLFVLIYTSIFADIDMNAYKKYKQTTQYQIAAAKPKGGMYTDMHATYSAEDNMLYWGLTLEKIESLTGDWADIGAIAKANHENFVYVTLTPVLKDSNGNEIYRCTMVQRKIMFGRENKINFSSLVPSNVSFDSVTIAIGLIADNSENKVSLNTPKGINNKKDKIKKTERKVSEEEYQASDQEREQYLKRKQELNESPEVKKILKRLKDEEIQKASTQEACLGYLKAVNEIMRKDDKRIKPTELATIESIQSTNQSIEALKEALIYANKYKKYNCKRFLHTTDVDNTQNAQNNYSSIIMANCEKKWGTDYSMVKYCVNKQTEAKNSMPSADYVILKNCQEKWGTDYSMVKYCVNKQTEAKKSLGL